MLGRGLRGARTEAHGRSGRTRSCAQRDPPPSVRGLAHRGAGSVRVKQSRSGPPTLTPARTSIRAPAHPAAPIPAPTPVPGPSLPGARRGRRRSAAPAPDGRPRVPRRAASPVGRK